MLLLVAGPTASQAPARDDHRMPDREPAEAARGLRQGRRVGVDALQRRQGAVPRSDAPSPGTARPLTGVVAVATVSGSSDCDDVTSTGR